MKSVLIIGAGISGLSEAALLAKEGYKVTILEKNSSLGGRARKFTKNNFIFDMGPSWYLMPEVFDKFFKEFNKKTSDYYHLNRLDPAYKVFYEDEGSLNVPGEKSELKKVFENEEKGASKKLDEYLDNAKYKYDVAMEKFLYKNYYSLIDFFKWEMISEAIPLQLFNSIDSFVSSKFKSHKLKKILEYSMVFLGGSPKNTPALYSLMTHVDLNLGVWYPDGGIYVIVDALEKLCKENKVKILKNKPVSKIIVEDGCATGVISKGKKYFADIIISNADYEHTDTKLLRENGNFSKKEWKSKIIGPSGFIAYLGMKKEVKTLEHHNLFLAKDWDIHFDTIFKNQIWPKNPCYYVSCTSKTDKASAPKGKDAVFIFVPIAPDLKDNKKRRDKFFDQIILDMEKKTGENFASNIEFKKLFSVNDFKNDYNSYKGSSLGMAHTLFQTAIFRPSNKNKNVSNLYYTGSYVHPGIGVPRSFR
jgi:phytoene desaturase